MAYPFEMIEKERLWGLISSQISVRGITGEQYFVSTGVEHDDSSGFRHRRTLTPGGGRLRPYRGGKRLPDRGAHKGNG
jgi:hypothetical protein